MVSGAALGCPRRPPEQAASSQNSQACIAWHSLRRHFGGPTIAPPMFCCYLLAPEVAPQLPAAGGDGPRRVLGGAPRARRSERGDEPGSLEAMADVSKPPKEDGGQGPEACGPRPPARRRRAGLPTEVREAVLLAPTSVSRGRTTTCGPLSKLALANRRLLTALCIHEGSGRRRWDELIQQVVAERGEVPWQVMPRDREIWAELESAFVSRVLRVAARQVQALLLGTSHVSRQRMRDPTRVKARGRDNQGTLQIHLVRDFK